MNTKARSPRDRRENSQRGKTKRLTRRNDLTSPPPLLFNTGGLIPALRRPDALDPYSCPAPSDDAYGAARLRTGTALGARRRLVVVIRPPVFGLVYVTAGYRSDRLLGFELRASGYETRGRRHYGPGRTSPRPALVRIYRSPVIRLGRSRAISFFFFFHFFNRRITQTRFVAYAPSAFHLVPGNVISPATRDRIIFHYFS